MSHTYDLRRNLANKFGGLEGEQNQPFFCLCPNSPPPRRTRASSFTTFLDHTQRRATVGRTPLDEGSARRTDLYLITHNTHNRQTSMTPGGIRTHNLSRRAAADLRLRPRGHRDRRSSVSTYHKYFLPMSFRHLFKWCRLQTVHDYPYQETASVPNHFDSSCTKFDHTHQRQRNNSYVTYSQTDIT